MRLLLVISFFMLFVSGCASIEPVERIKQPDRYSERSMPPVSPVSPALPQLPEVQAPVSRVLKPYRYSRAITNREVRVKPKVSTSKSRYKVKVESKYKSNSSSNSKYKPKPKYKAPVIQRYPSEASPQVSTLPNVNSEPPVETEGVEIDPYANIPENVDDKQTGSGSISTRGSTSSPAVEALLVRAYADAKLGRTDAAMIKLERGLRIEPQNPKLWNQLAELHYKKGNYQQAIAMVKKAINFSSNNEEMTAKNWRLLSDVAEKSGDSNAKSEVNEYNKRQ